MGAVKFKIKPRYVMYRGFSVHLRYERMLHICHRDERDFISCELLQQIRLRS